MADTSEPQANRAGGPPPPKIDDHRMGRLAYFAGWMSLAEVEEVLGKQKEALEEGDAAPPRFGEIAIEEGLLNRSQVGALLRIQSIHYPSSGDESFGSIAVRKNYVTVQELQACLAEQKQLLHQKLAAPPLGLMLCERGMISPEQARDILVTQARRSEGVLVQLEKQALEIGKGEANPQASAARPLPAISFVRGEAACRCDACGHIEARSDWRSDVNCPECGSSNFAPVPVVDNAIAYSLADRRYGPAPEDHRLGMMAYFAGDMTLEQVKYCINRQSYLIQTGQGLVKFGQLAIQLGFLDKEQVDDLLRMQRIVRPASHENTFGAVAVRMGFITEDQFEACLEEQWNTLYEHHEAPLLGMMLMEKGLLTREKVNAILQYQARHGQGPLGKPIEVEEERPQRHRLHYAKLAFGAFVIVFSMFASGTGWFGIFSLDDRKPVVGCGNCHSVFEPSMSTDARCPVCKGHRTLGPLSTCEGCGGVFLFGPAGSGRRCPYCEHINVKPRLQFSRARDDWAESRKKKPQ